MIVQKWVTVEGGGVDKRKKMENGYIYNGHWSIKQAPLASFYDGVPLGHHEQNLSWEGTEIVLV